MAELKPSANPVHNLSFRSAEQDTLLMILNSATLEVFFYFWVVAYKSKVI